MANSQRRLAAAAMRDNSILQGPPGTVRHFVDVHNASDLEYVPGKGWVNEAGDSVDISKAPLCGLSMRRKTYTRKPSSILAKRSTPSRAIS
jgi:hypothetical protein